MSYQNFLAQLTSKGNIVRADIDKLQNNWSQLVSLQGDFKNPIETIYDCYPYLFQSLFSDVESDELRQLSVAGRLFGASIILYDDFLDEDVFEKNARKLFTPLVMQWESQKILSQLFEFNSSFWEKFHSFYQDHIRACVIEESFRSGKRDWSDFTEELGLEITVGKNGISRAVVAGLVELSANKSVYEPLIEAINNFNISCQILDDLVDWKRDLKDATPSILLARVFDNNPHLLVNRNTDNTEILAKTIYYQGHAQYVLAIGLKAVEKSLDLLKQIEGDKTDWSTLVLMTKGKLEALLEDFEAIVQQNKQRVQTQLKVHLEIPSPSNDFESIAYQSLSFIIEQWRKGFGEARHIMNLPPTEGFSSNSKSPYRYGDVFQRALILETLCDVQNKLGLELEPIINYEVDYLLQARRQDKVGGWAYFPDVHEIAPDADDLGQVIQAFVLADRKEIALSYCEKPLKILLQNNLLDNGSVETWIVPKNNRTKTQEIQQQYNLGKWGVGPDTEVVANLFYSLFLYDPDRYNSIIKKAVNYLERVQDNDGSWNSRWYYGPFYGTYVCTRLIGCVKPDSPSIRTATQFLRETQNMDGGWGYKKSDQLNTSLALLGLAACAGEQSATIFEQTTPAVNFLKNSIAETDGWNAIDFIKPRIGEPYKSRTITAMYVLKAIATWQHLFSVANNIL